MHLLGQQKPFVNRVSCGQELYCKGAAANVSLALAVVIQGVTWARQGKSSCGDAWTSNKEGSAESVANVAFAAEGSIADVAKVCGRLARKTVSFK